MRKIHKVKRKKSFPLFGDYAYIPEGDLRKICILIDDITLLDDNPRKNNKAAIALAELIKKNGFRKAIVLNEKNQIKAGHTAYKAACKLGMKYIPALRSRFDDSKQEWDYVLSDNKASEFSDWDKDVLSRLMSQGSIFSDAEDGSGFSEEEIELISKYKPRSQRSQSEFAKGSFQKNTIRVLDGGHVIACGDSQDFGFMCDVVGDSKCDICFTSPPYNLNTQVRQDSFDGIKYSNDTDNKSNEDYFRLLREVFKCVLPLCYYSFVNIQMLSNNNISVIDFLSYYKKRFKDVIIWKKSDKPFKNMNDNVLAGMFEFIFVFGDNNKRNIGCKKFIGGSLGNVISFKREKNRYSKYHRAVFPLSMAEYFVYNFARKGKYVLDPFAGTGTTLIACMNTGRKGIMIDKDPSYCNLMLERYNKEMT